MNSLTRFHGVVPAVATPFDEQGRPELKNLQALIQDLKQQGVQGILLAGTTGEGPSLSLEEREEITAAGLEAASGLFVLAGTGCASLQDTLRATRRAFELGVDGVVTVPPFYFKNLKDEGLFAYFQRLFDDAVPAGRALFLYDIPQTTKVPLSSELIERLLAYAGERLAGIKDSTGDLDHTIALCERFPQLRVFVGSDKALLAGLQKGAAGCITAGTNLFASLAVRVYRAYCDQNPAAGELQETLTSARAVMEGYLPFPASVKSLLAVKHGTPGWKVRPPLVPLPAPERETLMASLKALKLGPDFAWLDGSAQ